MQIRKLFLKTFFKFYGFFNSKREFKDKFGFKAKNINDFLSKLKHINNSSSEALDHWTQITKEAKYQLKNDDSNFLRNKYIRDALHPDQYYYSWIFYKALRRTFSKSKLLDYCRDVGLGNPLRDIILNGASPTSIKHFYLLNKIQQDFNINLNKINFIVEFGGGYGSMCRVAFNNLGISNNKWSIIDLPIMLELQKLYLRETLSNINFQKINFFDNFSNIKIEDKSIFIATWSLSETPLEFRKKMETWLVNFEYIFIAFQENYNNQSNLDYFMDLKLKLKNSHKVKLKVSEFYPGHYYFNGQKLKEAK